MTKAEVRDGQTGRWFMAGFEDEVRGYRPNNAGGFQKLKKVRKQILSPEPPEEISSTDILAAAQ